MWWFRRGIMIWYVGVEDEDGVLFGRGRSASAMRPEGTNGSRTIIPGTHLCGDIHISDHHGSRRG